MTQGQMFTRGQYAPEASAYGTEGVSYAALPRIQNGSIIADNQLIHQYGLGEGLNVSNSYYGPFSGRGSVTFDVVDFDFLKHWIGQKTGSGTVGSKWTLTEATTIAAGASASGRLVPFSFEAANSDKSNISTVATGCVGLNFSLEGSIGSTLRCNAEFMAQKTRYKDSVVAYTPDTNPSFIMVNGTWKWGATPTAISGVQNFQIAYNNGIEPDSYRDISSRFYTIPSLGMRSYKFTVGILMTSSLATTIINDFYGLNSGGVRLPETGSVKVSPTTGLKFQVELVNNTKYATISIDDCSIDRLSQPFNLGSGPVVLTIEGTAKKGTSNAPIQWWNT